MAESSTPVSSISSRNAACMGVSPGSINPPGKAALRELMEETGVELSAMPELVGEFREPYRDPRMEHTWSWAFKMHVDDRAATTAGDDASATEWVAINELKNLPLAFDHADILRKALS